MIIRYLGHSCFKLDDESRSIVFDPFGDVGYLQEGVSCDYCVSSHAHYDHNTTDRVCAKRFICSHCDALPDFLKGVKTFHDECRGKKRGENEVYLYTSENGMVFCHAGDVGEPATRDLADKIGRVDILAVPVGGNYTIDAKGALDYVRLLAPRAVIPMHYKTNRSNIDIAGKDEFLDLIGREKVVSVGREVNFGSFDLNAFKPTVINFCDDEF